jgi:sucrose phosphorylase
MRNFIKESLEFLYGKNIGYETACRLEKLIDHWNPVLNKLSQRKQKCPLTNKTVFLITYGDQIKDDANPPLQVLHNVAQHYLTNLISVIHILPFYPYSSDDGFSVIDYYAVNPDLGCWDDIEAISRNFVLMFDGVFNHISAKSEWFKKFLEGDPYYRDFFIVPDKNMDLSRVVRPRVSPLLTSFPTAEGEKLVWTTFSADQVDLNYKNPEVLLKIIDVLLFYVSKGASFIRLDAIAYLWKESGTSCIHLPQTHAVVQIFRAILDEVSPWVRIITETNVPHKDNISYFGNGYNEAHLVYNFTLPPLVLYSLLTGNSEKLTSWAKSLSLPEGDVSFLNYLASHDGIGVMPLYGILDNSEIKFLTDAVIKRKGFISYKSNPDGSNAPYELNINYLDALSEPDSDSYDIAIKRFILAHAIMLSFKGIPAIYFHSLFGSRGDLKGALESGIPRRINREKLRYPDFISEMEKTDSIRRKIFDALARLISERVNLDVLSPHNEQIVVEAGSENFAFLRMSENERLLCIFNISGMENMLNIKLPDVFAGKVFTDVFTNESVVVQSNSQLTMPVEPYGFYWMRNFLGLGTKHAIIK